MKRNSKCTIHKLYAVHHNNAVRSWDNGHVSYNLQFLRFIKFMLKWTRKCKVKLMLNAWQVDRELILRKFNNFQEFFFSKRCFRAQKVIYEQMCEVHLHYRNSTTIWRFYTFFDLTPLYTNLFSLFLIFLLPSTHFNNKNFCKSASL